MSLEKASHYIRQVATAVAVTIAGSNFGCAGFRNAVIRVIQTDEAREKAEKAALPVDDPGTPKEKPLTPAQIEIQNNMEGIHKQDIATLTALTDLVEKGDEAFIADSCIKKYGNARNALHGEHLDECPEPQTGSTRAIEKLAEDLHRNRCVRRVLLTTNTGATNSGLYAQNAAIEQQKYITNVYKCAAERFGIVSAVRHDHNFTTVIPRIPMRQYARVTPSFFANEAATDIAKRKIATASDQELVDALETHLCTGLNNNPEAEKISKDMQSLGPKINESAKSGLNACLQRPPQYTRIVQANVNPYDQTFTISPMKPPQTCGRRALESNLYTAEAEILVENQSANQRVCWEAAVRYIEAKAQETAKANAQAQPSAPAKPATSVMP